MRPPSTPRRGLTAGGRDTMGTCHIVGSDMLTRQHLYVALTRGTDENHLYLSTAEGDPHRLLSPKATHLPDTAVDVLTRILARDGLRPSLGHHRRPPGCRPRRPAAGCGRYVLRRARARRPRTAPGVGASTLDAIADDVIPQLSQRDGLAGTTPQPVHPRPGGLDPRELLTEALAKGSVETPRIRLRSWITASTPAGTHSAGIGCCAAAPCAPGAGRTTRSGVPIWPGARSDEELATEIRERAWADQRHRLGLGAAADHRQPGADR